MKKITLPKVKKVAIPKMKAPKIKLNKIKITLKKDFIFAFMAYLPILLLVPMFLKHKNYFVEYHVRQGVGLMMLEVVLFFSFYIPVLPYIVALFIALMFLHGMYNIFTGKEKPLFVIGKWAEGIHI